MFGTKKGFLLSGILVLLLLAQVADGKTLEEELYEVDQLRAGFKTPFDEVEKRCNELLKKYTKPKEQGKIYYELTKVEGQSGFQRPTKAIEYAKKALELPQDPWEKVRLYIYWGDTIQVAHRGVHNQELVTARRKAVIPYLHGLKETLQYDLPEVKPDLPGVDRFDYGGPSDTEEYRSMIRKHQEQVEARKKAKFQRAMIRHRAVLTSQVSTMYSRFPFASNEIEKLANEILEDKVAVDRLMSAVNAAVQQRIKELGWEPPLLDITFPAQLSNEDEPTSKVTAQDSPGEPKSKEIFIPKASIALILERGFVLDFASGKLLNPAMQVDSEQVHKNLIKLGKGDIAWDGSLLSVRKAKVLTVRQESHRPLKRTLGRWCNSDRLPDKVDLPYSLLLVTNENMNYLISILKIKYVGIKIKYKKLTAEEAKSYYSIEKSDK
ncbi:MAG: hypothetical protein ACYSWZ_11345 [Planctomycetota bacterium]